MAFSFGDLRLRFREDLLVQDNGELKFWEMKIQGLQYPKKVQGYSTLLPKRPQQFSANLSTSVGASGHSIVESLAQDFHKDCGFKFGPRES